MSHFVSRFASGLASAVAVFGLAVASASAAPVVGPAGDAFYTPPTSVPASGTPGELIWYRPATLNLGTGAPAVTGWTVLYRSTDSKGNPNFVTGTVIIPKAAYGQTGRPLVSYAPGTQGLAKTCAPSRQLVAGTEYETPNIVAAVAAKYSVAITDYAGYTNGSNPSYLAGASEGHAALDIAKAARQLPSSANVAPQSKTVVWGYSQGGQAAGFAGEQGAAYAPAINLVGIAAGGVPGDFVRSAHYLNKAEGASFLLGGVIGLAQEYPEGIPFDSLANAAGLQARSSALAGGCVFKLLNQYRNADLATYVKNNQSLDQLLAIPSVAQTLAAQALGTKKIAVPVFQWHGQADEFLPLDQAYALKKKWCALGTSVGFGLYPSEHLATLFQAAPAVLQFLSDRFAGKTVANSCVNGLPDPVSTADAPGGDFNVALPKWKLSGTATLATLKQSLALPAGSTFDGSANLTTKQISGTVNIPYFTTTIDIAGIKVKTALELVPTGPTVGTVSLDDDGNLHIDASSPLVLTVRSLNAVGIQFGTDCRTQSSLHVPIRYDGPVSALGTGKLTSDTPATIPPLVNCGLYGPVLSSLIAATGNRFVLTVSAPDPRPY